MLKGKYVCVRRGSSEGEPTVCMCVGRGVLNGNQLYICGRGSAEGELTVCTCVCGQGKF